MYTNKDSMQTKINNKPAALMLPLTALKCLYKSARGKRIVCEIDLASLRKFNEPSTIDEMVAEARLEYFTGKTKSFTDSKQLLAYLNG